MDALYNKLIQSGVQNVSIVSANNYNAVHIINKNNECVSIYCQNDRVDHIIFDYHCVCGKRGICGAMRFDSPVVLEILEEYGCLRLVRYTH
jgi:hypothetical protein